MSEHLCDEGEPSDRDVGLAALDGTEEGRGELGALGDLLQGQSSLLPEPADDVANLRAVVSPAVLVGRFAGRRVAGPAGRLVVGVVFGIR